MRLSCLKKFPELVSRLIFIPVGKEENLSRFERSWRPLFGYCISLTWTGYMFTVCYVALNNSAAAPEIINAMVETTSLWGVALGVLGVSVVKSNQVHQASEIKSEISQN